MSTLLCSLTVTHFTRHVASNHQLLGQGIVGKIGDDVIVWNERERDAGSYYYFSLKSVLLELEPKVVRVVPPPRPPQRGTGVQVIWDKLFQYLFAHIMQRKLRWRIIWMYNVVLLGLTTTRERERERERHVIMQLPINGTARLHLYYKLWYCKKSVRRYIGWQMMGWNWFIPTQFIHIVYLNLCSRPRMVVAILRNTSCRKYCTKSYCIISFSFIF